jgi:hypothetical protein
MALIIIKHGQAQASMLRGVKIINAGVRHENAS